MIRFITLLIFTALLAFACTDKPRPLIPAPNPGKLETKQTISFAGTLRTADTGWYGSDDGVTQIIAFNKADYPQAQHAIFATMIRTSSDQNKVFAQLYNLTDSIRITDSEIFSTCECFRWVETEDILKQLPDKPVLLAVRIRSENEGHFVSTNYNSFLTMYNR